MKLLGMSVKPGTTRRNKTGGWRIQRPIYDWDKCTGCNTCETICPDGCITHAEKKQYVADLDFCKGCGLCAEMCPVDAITMKEEVK
jgi:2-oxoacid:acceptor oxidoreductase delta subunit (pyruvate/2-ketoisovalerate family)